MLIGRTISILDEEGGTKEGRLAWCCKVSGLLLKGRKDTEEKGWSAVKAGCGLGQKLVE